MGIIVYFCTLSMKRERSNILSCLTAVVIMLLYLVSTMGYGVHECKAEGTKDIIVLFGESPCEFVHTHNHTSGYDNSSAHNHAHNALCEKGCCNHHTMLHGAGCCKTTVYSATQDQQVKSTVMDFQAPSFDIANFLSDARELFVIHAFLEISFRVQDKIPLTDIGDILSDISVFNI